MADIGMAERELQAGKGQGARVAAPQAASPPTAPNPTAPNPTAPNPNARPQSAPQPAQTQAESLGLFAGLWRRTPPAIFPPVLGLLGLGVAWRLGLREFNLPPHFAEIQLSFASLLFLLALTAYLAKLIRRPSALVDDLTTLPGRSGIGGAVLCLYSMAGVILPYDRSLSAGVLFLGLAVHVAVAVLLLRVMFRGPPALRVVTPVWHLNFAGTIVAGVVAEALGFMGLARFLFVISVPVALWIWWASARLIWRQGCPPAARPMLAIHMSPANFLGFVALGLGWNGVAHVFGVITGLLVLVAVFLLRWLTAGGFSPMWGAFTFPITSSAAYWLTMGGPWRHPGMVLVVAATVIVPVLAARILWLWWLGILPERTGAARA